MANVKKYNKSAVSRMLAHYNRENQSYSNEEIDVSKSDLNYRLIEKHKNEKGEIISDNDFLNQRLSEVKVQKRKDVNVMCDWVVTAPQTLPTEELEDFFSYTFDFLSARYGKENVVSANVHMDETTPHLHFAFIPVVKTKKTNKETGEEEEFYKVSAKEVITRNELRHFHQDLQSYLERCLEHQVEILNGATANGNKTIQQLKAETLEKKTEN